MDVRQRPEEVWTPEPLDNSSEARSYRCLWVAENADLVATVHALRVELQVRYVMADIVPCTPEQPFLFWLRFEWGTNGNPHTHGSNYVSGNPAYECIVEDDDTRQEMIEHGHSEAYRLKTKVEAEKALGEFFDQYVTEWHPAKDADGNWHPDTDEHGSTLRPCV